jgi:predicted NAD/FAD-binding protein
MKKSLSRRFGRRSALKGLAGIGAGALVGCNMADASEKAAGTSALAGRPRVAVIGGGASGIFASYFLDGLYDVVIFEAQSALGGNADSRTLQYQGQSVVVDVGPQFFHPDTHPIYMTLLEELGLYTPDHPDTDATVEADGSLTVFPIGGGWPLIASTAPLLTPKYLLDFAIYTQAARLAITGNMPWEITLGNWVNSLLVSSGFKKEVLRPWLAALVGATTDSAMRASARSILSLYALAFPANIFQGAKTYNSKIGVQGNLQHVIDATAALDVRLNAQVQGLSFDGQSWTVQTASAAEGPFDAVIVNAPAYASKDLLKNEPSASDIVSLLASWEYFDVRILIHSDPAYVHADRLFWATYNAGVDGSQCEGSAWLAPFHDKLPGGKTVDLFKSWANRRRVDPKSILAERRFKHPLITPQVLPAIRALTSLQGRNGLYFAGGAYRTAFEDQESCVYTASKVARALAPASQTLASLEALLSARGRSGISYDV